MDLSEALRRDIPGKVSQKTTAKLAAHLDGATECVAAAADDKGKTLIAVTDRGISIASESHDAWGYTFDEMHSISLVGSDPVLFVPLRAGHPFSAVQLSARDASRLAEAARSKPGELHEPGDDWWDSPFGELGVAVWPAGLLVKPASSSLPERTWYTVSFVNTGVQIRTVRHPKMPSTYPGDYYSFVPWPAIRDVSVEGADQIERRPSVGAVLVFGVLGLGASKAIKRSYLVIATDDGDYVFERQELLPLELSGYLAPVLRQMHHVAQQDDPMARLLEAQQETNRLLALILDEVSARRTAE